MSTFLTRIMGLYSRSSPGGFYQNANAIRFEDKKGEEQLWIHAERNQDIEVERDETLTVGNDKRDKIGRHWTLSTGGYKQETVKLASVQSVGLGKMMNVGMAYNVNVGGLYLRQIGLQMSSLVGLDRTDRVVQSWNSDVGHVYSVTVRGKAVETAVKKSLERPLVASPDFEPQLLGAVESSEANQIRLTDTGESSLSGAHHAKLIGPGGVITIDEAGIRLRGKGIYLQAPIISMSGGEAQGLVPVTEADCAECSKRTTTPYPVDVATGQKILVVDDFVLPGRLPIRWSRMYRSADQREGSLGVAWKLPYASEVRQGSAGLIYIDVEGRRLNFPELAVGEEYFHSIEKYTLQRVEDKEAGRCYRLRFTNGNEEQYAVHPQDHRRWQLHRITTRDGQQLDLQYTAQGALQQVQNNRYTVRCELDAEGRIQVVRLVGDEDARELARYTYDEQGDLIRAVDRAARVWHYRYIQHLLTEYRTPAGAVHVSQWRGNSPTAQCVRTYAYAEQGANDAPVITRDMRFVYQPAAKITQVTNGLGHTTEYRYNGLWAVDRITYPDGSVEHIHFDETGSVSGHTDALGRSTRFMNNAAGSPTSMVDAAGNVTGISYNAQNQPVQITDPAGHVWQRSYDDTGNLISETDPQGLRTAYAYTNGLPVSRTDAMDNVWTMQWDKSGQIVSRTDCSGNQTRYQYDRRGQLTATINALGQVDEQQWNAGGQVTGHKPAGMGWSYLEYDQAARVIAQSDALQRSSRIQWDAYDQPVAVMDAAKGHVSFEYDALGQLIKMSNAKGESTSFTYDARGRRTAEEGFDGRRQRFQYNAVGELIERVDCGLDGQITTTYVYDVLGRLIERRVSDGLHVSYRYDVRGHLTQAQRVTTPGQPASRITYDYDASGRKIAEMQVHHGRVWRMAHQLDALGNRLSSQIPEAGELKWLRYGSGHVHEVLLNDDPVARFERDGLHREIVRTQGRVAHQFGYSQAGWLEAHLWQDLDSENRPVGDERGWRVWRYDAAGQLVSLRDVYRGYKSYQYDALARVTEVKQHSEELGSTYERFAYDSADNLLALIKGRSDDVPVPLGMMGQAAGNRLMRLFHSQVPDQELSYTYDGHGNRLSRMTGMEKLPQAIAADSEVAQGVESVANDSGSKATHYHYDGDHQLRQIDHADGASTQYRYDAFGRRIAKQHTNAQQQTKTTLFMWDGDWMVQEIEVGEAEQKDHIRTFICHPDFLTPLAYLSEPYHYRHYVTDHLGTPQEIYDDSHTIVWAAEMDAYGQVSRQLVSEVDNPIRFPGQYYDAESGLHYNRFRYYDPQAGRYINQDPIGLLGGLNSYGYSYQNPLLNTDPDGLNPMTGCVLGSPAGGLPGCVVGGIAGGVVVLVLAVTSSLSGSSSSQSETSDLPSEVKDRAGRPVSSRAETLEPPGDCDPGKHRKLQDEVERTCKSGQKRSCDGITDPIQAGIFKEQNLQCALARNNINEQCFAGGDLNHRNEAISAWDAVANCEKKINARSR